MSLPVIVIDRRSKPKTTSTSVFFRRVTCLFRRARGVDDVTKTRSRTSFGRFVRSSHAVCRLIEKPIDSREGFLFYYPERHGKAGEIRISLSAALSSTTGVRVSTSVPSECCAVHTHTLTQIRCAPFVNVYYIGYS